MVSKKKGKKKDAGISDIIRANKGKFAILLIAIVIPVAIFGAVVFGGFFGIEPPPEEYATGYAIVNFWDYYVEEFITGVDLYIQDMNGTNYLNTTSGNVFYVPEASYFFAVKSGYWNESGAVWAQGATSSEAYNQTYIMYKSMPKEYVNVSIIYLDGIYKIGGYTSADITDGYHEVTFHWRITGEYFYTSAWGVGSWVPPMFISNTSYAYNYSIYMSALWIGWNGTITNYLSAGSGINEVYDVGIYNTTYTYLLCKEGEWRISANFKDLTNATFYYGLLDDVTNLAIPF